MLNISFRRHSLLYGESCFLAIIAFSMPFFFWPEGRTMEDKHFLTMTNTRRFALRLLERGAQIKYLRISCLALIMLTQLAYACLLVTFGIIVQKDFMLFIGTLEEEELAYKALYYAPIVFRMGLFVMIVIVLKNRANYLEWPTFNHYEIFSVDRPSQARLSLACFVIIVPDLICSWTDMVLLLSFCRSERYKWFRYNSPRDNFIFLSAATVISVTSCALRYKPFVSVMYAAMCVGRHMRLIKCQLYLSYKHNHKQAVRSLATNEATNWHQLSRKSASENSYSNPMLLGNSRQSIVPINEELGPHNRQMADQFRRELYTKSLLSPSDKKFAYKTKSPPATPAATPSVVWTALDEWFGFKKDDGFIMAEDPLYEIKNLFELERHLTQVQLFTASLDHCSPSSVFALVFVNSIGFFYVLLFFVTAGIDQSHYFIAVIGLTARLLPIFVFFIVAHLLELECRKTISLLEIAHLEENSHSLLFKHMKDSQLSLARTLRLLRKIKFTGDGLISINLDSLKRLMFYIISGILIVIQYDLLLAIELNVDGPGSSSLAHRNSTHKNNPEYKPSLKLN